MEPDARRVATPVSSGPVARRSSRDAGVAPAAPMPPESTMREPLHRTMLSGLERTVRRLSRRGRDVEPVPVHFLHVGKTGGTAIKHAIGSAQASSSGDGAGLPYIVHLHRHAVTLRDVPAGERFFFFVRDPVGRFISGFYSRQRKGRPRYSGWWSEQEREAYGRFGTPDQLASALSSANDEVRASAESAMRSIPHVGDGYWKWFESEDYFLSRLDDLFFIGFQKHLTDDFAILKSRLRLPKDLMLPDDDVQSHANPRHLDRFLGDTSAANLYRWYEKDYAFMKLCDRVVRERPHIRAERPPFTFPPGRPE